MTVLSYIPNLEMIHSENAELHYFGEMSIEVNRNTDHPSGIIQITTVNISPKGHLLLAATRTHSAIQHLMLVQLTLAVLAGPLAGAFLQDLDRYLRIDPKEYNFCRDKKYVFQYNLKQDTMVMYLENAPNPVLDGEARVVANTTAVLIWNLIHSFGSAALRARFHPLLLQYSKLGVSEVT